MAAKVSNFTDLVQRVAASCLLHPLGSGRINGAFSVNGAGDEDDFSELELDEPEEEVKEEEEIGGNGGGFRVREEEGSRKEVMEMEMAMWEVFDAVSAMKRAYAGLQKAHSPWDPEKMRVADVAVVGELRKLGVLRERFRRRCSSLGGYRGGGAVAGGTLMREVVAPYEAAVDELKKEVKAKEVEVDNLKEKLSSIVNGSNGNNGKKGRSISRRKVGCSQLQVVAAPAPDLFESTMSQVKEASKSFTSLLLSLMRAAHWDIAAAVRSIEAATVTATTTTSINTSSIVTTMQNGNAKYALQSYISSKMFQGFDHETFYMDGSLSSLLNPDQYRRDCFTQYHDMKAMDPAELLGILPTCAFGKFCSNKYLAIVHPKMEESLFGDLDQRRQVLDGNHPRSEFYSQFLGMAKSVWLLHLLAFSLDPTPSQFEATRGAEFHPHYMESVVKFSGVQVPLDQVVGFKSWVQAWEWVYYQSQSLPGFQGLEDTSLMLLEFSPTPINVHQCYIKWKMCILCFSPIALLTNIAP